MEAAGGRAPKSTNTQPIPVTGLAYVGKDGKILEIDTKVTPATSVTDIIAKLDKHGVEKK